ncbi:MAG: hypothetical protein L3J41_00280 [Melioribacteraceae bacterium]|nr:hypothetical protein [Melioribacteraceae bacterium]
MVQLEKYLIIDNGINNMKRIIFILFLSFSSIFSQDPNWSSFITFPQYPSPYFNDWERNPNIGNLNINYTGSAPVEFYFEIVISLDEYGEAIRGRTENREYLSGPVSEMLTFNDISDWVSTNINADLERVIIQTGKLPESDYSICVSAFSLNGNLLTEACTNFEIALPNPPQLISPEDEGSIEVALPTFMWNPVTTPADVLVYYHLKIVEKLERQDTYRALEANVPVVETEIPYENLYTFRLDDYPLEQNQTYVWQVQATNDEGMPVSTNDGYSEIWQFTFGSPSSGIEVDTLMLIEDFAYIFDLEQLNITDNQTYLNLDGSCRMLIRGSDGIDKYVDVFAQNLMVQKETYDNPVFLGGNIIGSIYDEIIPKEITGSFFRPTELEFIPPQQFTIGGEFYLGEDVTIPLNGRLSYIDKELIGDISLIGDPTTPIFELGDGSFELNITALSLTYPNVETNLEGKLSIFGTPSNCTVTEIDIDKDGSYSANIGCNLNQEIALLQGSTLFNLNINNIEGKISGNLLRDKMDYNILVDGGLVFNTNPDNSFGAEVIFELKPNDFKLISFNPSADIDASSIDFGWVKWNMERMKLNNLAYQNGIWDFDLSMNIDISFPDFTDRKLPTIQDISFTPRGFEFPEIKYNNFSIPNINFMAFDLEIYGFSAPAFTFDLSKWTPGSIAQMNFGWNVKFNMPNLPNGTDEKFRFPNYNLKASIKNGNFNLSLPRLEFPSGMNIPLSGLARFNVNLFEGELNTNFDGSLMNFLPDVKIGGEITLPEALQCDGQEGSIKLETMLNLNGNGSISGIIEDVVPKCPINIGLASLYMKKSKVEFKNEDGQKIYLDGEAGIKFTSDPRQKEVGKISVIYEVLNNEIIKAEGEIKEKFTWDLAGENPTFSFEIERAKIDEGKLKIDGRSQLVMDGGEKMGVTFDKFTIDLDEYSIDDGRVIFDEPFAMVVDGLENDEINFRAVPKGNVPKTENFLYYELPDKIALDKNGFTVVGKSKALLNYQGKELGDLTTEFSEDFSFSLAPFKVARGKCDIFFKEDRVAYFNADGFFPDLNYFLNRVIPDKIPLPTLGIAYLQIKRDDNLLINLRTEGNSTRFSTRDGEPVELVFPSMQFDLPEAPRILVNFDISFDDVTGEVTDGFISGVIPEESIPTFDLTRVGIPYTIYSIYYGNIDGINKFRLTGKAKLFETEVACQDSMTLTLSQNGILEGRVACDVEQIIPLIPDSDKLNLHLNTVSGEFNADLLNLARNFDFDLQLDSDVRFNMSENESWGVWTLLGLNFEGLRLIDSRIDDVPIPKIDLERFKIGIENFTLGRLDYNSTPDADGNSGWDFEFGMDLDLEFPSLGLEIPNIPNVLLNRTGFHTMNRISIPSFPDSLAFEFQGIELKPLAFRMPRLDFNWFNPMGGGENNNWDFDIDFEINFPNMEGGSGSMRYPRLTMLDASFIDGMIIGNIELAEFDLLDELKLNFGDGFGFSITGISGGLFDDNGSQGIGFNFNGHMDLPEYMRCDGEETSVDLTDASFSLNSSGHISGIVENFVPRCPIDLGFGHFIITSSSINFSVADFGQVAILDMTGDLVVNTGDDNTVTANGMLQMDLLTGQIIDGSITIEEQFVWAIPNDNPVLRFTIDRAVLDMDGLTIDGESDLLLPGGQTRNARFENFKFDYRKYKVISGSLEIDADFAIKLAIENGNITWTAIPADEPLTENQTAKIGFTSNLILDVNGLSTSGEAFAAIRWDEATAAQFGNLRVRYRNDFKFSLSPFKVSEGRADLIHIIDGDESIIATLTHDGLNLGDIFGVIPIPEIIPLPTPDIAYLRIKSGGRVLVQSERVDAGLRIYSTEENPTSLLLPSLQIEGREVDSIPTVFDVVINPATGQIVSGEITLARDDSTSIINLRDRGIPVDLFKIDYSEGRDGNYRLTADAQVDLPGIMDGMPIKMRRLRFNNGGLSGSVNLGTYSEVYPRRVLPTLDFAPLGEEAIITLEGLDVSFGENNTFGFSGKFIPLMFVSGRDTTKVQYAANWNNDDSKFSFSFDFADGENFDFGIGTFTPMAIGDEPAMKLSLLEDDFEFYLNGEFAAEQFGEDFALLIEGLKITSNSVSAEEISKPRNNPISFKLFNSNFRIFDSSPNSKAISFTYRAGVLKLILSGELDVFGNTTQFTNFTIGTDGTFSIGGANFLDGDLTIVDNYLSLNRIGISNNKLAVGGWIKLPEPVGSDTQFDFGFNIDANGSISADERIGNQIIFINEPQRIGNPAATEYDFWKAKFDVTYLALHLNFNRISESSIVMVSDIYWDNNRNKRVSLGDKSNMNNIRHGLEIDFTGNVEWGSATVNGNFVNFDEDMFKVKINTVQLTSDNNNNLTFGIGGEFGLNFEAVEGGLDLAGFQFNKTGIVDIGRITGGTLTITDVGSLSLNNIGYSDSQTRIWVKGGEIPTGNNGASGDSVQITVNNYLSFGGEITIDGFGSAGVDRFLSYETDNSYTLLVRNAHFEIEGSLDATLDLLYYTGDAGFLIRAGGRARIADFDAIVVGKIAKINNQVSWGFFISTEVRIDITPIVITGVGGGFFYNPTADDILTVKRLADVGGSEGKIAVQGGRFAIFLFGQAAIVSDVLIYGRVLITITDRQFMLDGKVVLLDMENKIEGTIRLMVQWSPTFEAEGVIEIDINVARIIKGDGRLGFYVYSADQWAIYGEADAELFKFLEMGSEFYVGNSGFMLGMNSSVDFDIWIIEVGAGIEVKVWYIQGQSWGAYAEAYVYAEVLWGVASARGWLKCALIGSGGNTYLYGQAGLRIRTFLYDWDGSVWAKISNGKLSGGRGSDSDMDALIAEAAGQSAAAEREMDEMKTSIENRPPTVQTFSDEELLQIYGALAEIGRKYKYGTRAEQDEANTFFHYLSVNEYIASNKIPENLRQNYEVGAIEYIKDIYRGVDAPSLTEYQNDKESVDSIITVYSDALSEVMPLLETDFETIEAIEGVDAQTTDDPTVGSNFGSYTKDAEGNYTRLSNPSMNLDEEIANANKSNMENAERTAQNYNREVMAKIIKINENIGIIENALVGADGSNGLEGTATKYGTLITKISAAYKTEFKFSREMELWAREKNVVRGGSPRARWLVNLNRKSRLVYDNATWNSFMNLALTRLRSMNTLKGELPEEVNRLSLEEQRTWIDERSKIRDVAGYTENDFRTFAINRTTDLGRQLWIDVPRIGLEAVIDQSQRKIRRNHTERSNTIEDMGSVQAHFTTRLNSLYYSLADLSETKYDILTQLMVWVERDADPNKPQTELNILRGMKNELTQKMEVPAFTMLRAINQDRGIYSLVPIIWNVQNGLSNRYKFMIDYSSNSPDISSSGYQAVGDTKAIVLYYTPTPGQTTFGNTEFKVKARNQVGYTIHRSLNFTPTFSNRTADVFGGVSFTDPESDNSPPSISPFIVYPYIPSLVENDNEKIKYMVSDSSRIEGSWSGSDNQTGIQEYRYKFSEVRNPENNNPGANDDNNEPYSDWTTNFGRSNVVISELNMEHNKVYQLKVVAKNGDGLWSERAAGARQYIFADLTPPTKPTFPFAGEGFGGGIRIGIGGFGDRGWAAHYTVNPLLPENNLPLVGVDKYVNIFDNSNVEFNLNWNEAEDPESGIFRYEIQVSNKSDESLISDWKRVPRRTEITLDNSVAGLNEMFNYVDTFKVAVRAINKAKKAGKSGVKYVKFIDLTPPTRPDVASTYTARSNRPMLIFSQHSRDLQTGVDHYEVAVSSQPNGEFDILSWDNARTFPIRNVSYVGRYTVTIPENNVSYIAVRAVNNDGVKGRFCYTGPFYQDNTRPERPEVSLLHDENRFTKRKTLIMNFSNLRDNESGIKHVQYRLYKKEAGNNSWTSVIYWRPSESLNSAAINLTQYGIGNNTDLKVQVRSMNNVGLLSFIKNEEYRLRDVSPPLEPTVTITTSSISKGEKGVGLTFGNIVDPESGIEKIQYKIEKATPQSLSYSRVVGWRSNGIRTTKTFMYSQYGLRTGQSIRVSVRTVNNDGLVSTIQSSIKTLD